MTEISEESKILIRKFFGYNPPKNDREIAQHDAVNNGIVDLMTAK